MWFFLHIFKAGNLNSGCVLKMDGCVLCLNGTCKRYQNIYFFNFIKIQLKIIIKINNRLVDNLNFLNSSLMW